MSSSNDVHTSNSGMPKSKPFTVVRFIKPERDDRAPTAPSKEIPTMDIPEWIKRVYRCGIPVEEIYTDFKTNRHALGWHLQRTMNICKGLNCGTLNSASFCRAIRETTGIGIIEGWINPLVAETSEGENEAAYQDWLCYIGGHLADKDDPAKSETYGEYTDRMTSEESKAKAANQEAETDTYDSVDM